MMMITKRPGGGSMALLSGFLGATASCFAKFAFDPDSAIAVQARSLCDATVKSDLEAAA